MFAHFSNCKSTLFLQFLQTVAELFGKKALFYMFYNIKQASALACSIYKW